MPGGGRPNSCSTEALRGNSANTLHLQAIGKTRGGRLREAASRVGTIKGVPRHARPMSPAGPWRPPLYRGYNLDLHQRATNRVGAQPGILRGSAAPTKKV